MNTQKSSTPRQMEMKKGSRAVARLFGGTLALLLPLMIALPAIADHHKGPKDGAKQGGVERMERAHERTREHVDEKKQTAEQKLMQQVDRMRANGEKQAAKAREQGDEERAQRIEAQTQKRIENLERQHAERMKKLESKGEKDAEKLERMKDRGRGAMERPGPKYDRRGSAPQDAPEETEKAPEAPAEGDGDGDGDGEE